jgi:predicted PurR-regulated permease PerM
LKLPAPTQRQGQLLWTALTGLSIAILIALVGLLFWGLGWLVNRLYAVLLPLAVAGILAYLLDPVVDFLERRGVPRGRAIGLVFLLAIALVVLLLGTVVPRLVYEMGELIDRIPEYAANLRAKLSVWLQKSPRGMKAMESWEKYSPQLTAWLTEKAPVVSAWVLARAGQVFSWAGLVFGLLLVPVYMFYFLKEKQAITARWTNYLPLHESRWKEEAIFVLRSVNDSLIVFFRGQVLVAICVGTLTAICFSIMGLNYALLLGFMTGVLGIVPYLGVICSIVPAVLLAAIQFGDWKHPLMVVAIFAGVNMAEGWIISPKIIGDRVGLHPLTIIVAIMVGTTLLGGILGGVLAIPLTAALRTLMFRYVWGRTPATGRIDSRQPDEVKGTGAARFS